MTPDGLRALLSPEGWALLAELPPYDEAEAVRLGERLRREGHPGELVAAALTQSRLRERARAKFGEFAAQMLFTVDGLEQATRLDVAAGHAARFQGAARVADLGCGIGADAFALAGVDTPVLAVERDEATAAIASVNLRFFEHAEVRHADLNDVDLAQEGVDAVWLDPARRRSGGGRVLDPRRAEPPWDVALGLARSVRAAGVKTAPGIDHALIPDDAEAQWVSVDGSVVEASVWFGDAARGGVARAAVVTQGSRRAELTWPQASPPRARVGDVSSYLFEPDGAVMRAGLVGPLAEQLGAHGIDPSIGYLTADQVTETPLGAWYRVVDRMPFGEKRLRAYLREREVGRLTVKKRGSAVEPEQLRRRMRLSGPREATVALTRLAGTPVVLVLEPQVSRA